MVNNTHRPLYLREGTPILIGYEAGWAQSGAECFGEEKYIAAAGSRNQDCPARSLDNSVHFISVGVTFWLNSASAKYRDNTKRNTAQHTRTKCITDKNNNKTMCRELLVADQFNVPILVL